MLFACACIAAHIAALPVVLKLRPTQRGMDTVTKPWGGGAWTQSLCHLFKVDIVCA